MKYHIYTKYYSMFESKEKWCYLYNDDNTYAYGVVDLKYKIQELKKMDIEVCKIVMCFVDGSVRDVTKKYIK